MYAKLASAAQIEDARSVEGEDAHSGRFRCGQHLTRRESAMDKMPSTMLFQFKFNFNFNYLLSHCNQFKAEIQPAKVQSKIVAFPVSILSLNNTRFR